ncbi:MAG: phage N-6-adenine-methyltransferase [Caulobacterales bacterium]|nr:phage N-6-adenine-methyltransferase [Caulobacterales bacterium]
MPPPALFSSRRDDWETPQDFFNRLDAVFHFELDAAATAANAKCARFFSPAEDGLAQDWRPHRRVWLNPPYGRGVERWMRKAYQESLRGCLVACLVPARTDTRWWHAWVKGKARVTFVRRRLRFSRPGARSPAASSAVFPSAVVVYGLDLDRILNGPGAPAQ